MEKLRNSGRARIAALAAAVLAAGVFASLAAAGYGAKLVSFSHTSPTAAQYPQSKVTICHHTHSQTNPFVTITVSVHALPAHLKHGDTVGPCTDQAPPAPVVGAKVHKLHKAHPSKSKADKSRLHRHGKPAKTKPVEKTHGKSEGAKGHSQAPTSPTTVHGKSQAQTKTHGSSNGQGKSHGKDHAKTHGPGNGGGQGQGNGHGHGQGPGDTHGNSGGGKGNGHKP
jgi:hypothetical protein